MRGKRSVRIEHNILYSHHFFDFDRAEGGLIWDVNGKEYIDFTSGWNVVNLGYNHPEVAEAIQQQARKNTYASMWITEKMQIEYAEALCGVLPVGLDVIVKAVTGTEGNEEAIKLARVFTGRGNVVSFRGAYHGQSYETIALGASSDVVQRIGPMPSGVLQLDFPESSGDPILDADILNSFRDMLREVCTRGDVAAVLCEAGIVTGSGMTSVAPDGFLTCVRDITQEYGALLILDEVGTGFSRCGTLFGFQEENVVPDMLVLAKAITNGAVPMAVCVTTREIAEQAAPYAMLISSFGYSPLGAAAAKKVLEIHLRDKVWEKAKRDGAYIADVLKRELGTLSCFVGINSKGMEIGLRLNSKNNQGTTEVDFAKRVVEEARATGLLLRYMNASEVSNIQIMPPLTMERAVLDRGLAILIQTLRGLG